MHNKLTCGAKTWYNIICDKRAEPLPVPILKKSSSDKSYNIVKYKTHYYDLINLL